jgi:hypothetical protein
MSPFRKYAFANIHTALGEKCCVVLGMLVEGGIPTRSSVTNTQLLCGLFVCEELHEVCQDCIPGSRYAPIGATT